MLTRSLALSTCAVALATLAACSGGSQSPISPTPDLTDSQVPTGSSLAPETLPFAGPIGPQVNLGTAVLRGDIAQSALAIYTIEVNPATLGATVALKEARTGAANDDLYQLSIDKFLAAKDFQVTSIGASATTLDITWALSHPFPAPNNPTGAPNGFSNRADLGIAGQVLVLSDVADATGNTYFTDVVVNTALVINPDGYTQPAGLLTLGTPIANTFPYQTLVDETGLTGSRVGISNGGIATGNFGSDGWTSSKFGGTSDGWSGFGVLHQGQTTSRTLQLDRALLTSMGSFSLDIAVLAKYNDPRGGDNAATKRGNRLPPATADTTKFAYRMPHGALDVERVEFLGDSGGFLTDQLSASTLTFGVVDWDARATETTETDLSLDLDVTHVAVGEAGLPFLSVCIPGVLGDTTAEAVWDASADILDDDSAFGGDAGQDTGAAADALVFQRSVTKLITSGQTDGTYTGLVRVSDIESALTTPLVTPLDAVTLLPLTADLPAPVNYQSFTVDMITPNAVPNVTVVGPGATVASGNGQLTLQVQAYSDGDSDPIDIQFDWNDDGDFGDAGEAFVTLSGATPLNFNAPGFYINPAASSDARQVPYQYTDGVILNPITGTINWTLGANQAPVAVAGALPAGTVLSGSPAGTVMVRFTSWSDAEGDPIIADIDWNNDGDYVDAGESGHALSGVPPAIFNAPTPYNNPTGSNQTRNIPTRYSDGVQASPVAVVPTPSFTLGANRAPVVNSGTLTLANSSILEPATFALQNNTLNVTDPEGDAITYTVRGVPTSGATQTASGIGAASLNGYNASPVMGAWNAVNSTIAFTVFANDALHATTSGTTVPSSPLTGTVTPATCGLDMSAVNLALATLTGSAVLRTGTGANQSITGVRLTWTNIAGEAEFLIQRGNWTAGALVSSVTFSNLGTVGANVLTYDDNTVSAQGTRYLYRVLPRCTVGGLAGTPSQLAMIAMQNFEGTTNGANVLDTTGVDGWLANYRGTTASSQDPVVTYTSAGSLIGSRSLQALEFGHAGALAPFYVTYSPPQLNDRTALGTLSVSNFELVHSWGNGGSQTSGYGILTNTARPANGDTAIPLDPNNWVWADVSDGRDYNDNNSAAFVGAASWFTGISPSGNYNWGNSGGALTETFSRADCAPGTITAGQNFAFIAFVCYGSNGDEDARVDELAWIVY